MKLLVQKEPRALALHGETHSLVIREIDNPTDGQPVVVVDLTPNAQVTKDQGWKTLLRREIYGCLGLIRVGGYIFIAVVTGAVTGVASPLSYESVDRIYSVDFACLSNANWDDWDMYTSGTSGGTSGNADGLVLEHPCVEMQKIWSNGSFYYSNDFDLTGVLQSRGVSRELLGVKKSVPDIDPLPTIATPDFMWNHFMMKELLKFRANLDEEGQRIVAENRFLTSAIRGFAKTVEFNGGDMTVISKQSWRRAGTRFNARGINDDGHVANFVETEYIMWIDQSLYAYTEIRGSVPAFWEQDTTLINPKITIQRSVEASQPAFDAHFERLNEEYGVVHVVNLLSFTKSAEVMVSDRYKKLLATCSRRDEIEYTEWDFHAETKQLGFAAATRILPMLRESMKQFGWFEYDISSGKTITKQDGIFRTNCLDCLDRTNLIQQVISLAMVDRFLREISSRHSAAELQPLHNNIWADNGDAISQIYTGTNALKSSFTRSGKMNFAGALSDVTKSVSRMYQNTFVDGRRQQTMDMMLGVDRSSKKVKIYDPCFEFVGTKLKEESGKFTTYQGITMWTGTFNLNGKEPERANLRAWLLPPESEAPADIYAVGLQEIIDLNAGAMFTADGSKATRWARIIGEQLGSEYVLIRSESIASMCILLYGKKSQVPNITQVSGASKKTGMGGMTANKGACAVRFKYGATTFALLTSHLAAGTTSVLERYNDYTTILNGLTFTRNYTITDHDHVIWFGDLNYRIDLPNQECRELVDVGAWDELLRVDQLQVERINKGAFYGFLEGKIRFFPTYKFDKGTNNYDSSEKQRVPSWTDRVVWMSPKKFAKHRDITQSYYNSVMDILISDHKPVYAEFNIRCEFVDDAKKSKLRKQYTNDWKRSHGPIGVHDLVDIAVSDSASVSSSFTNDALLDMNLPAATSAPPPPPPRPVGAAPTRRAPPEMTPLSPKNSSRTSSPALTTAAPPPPPPPRRNTTELGIKFSAAPLIPSNSPSPAPTPAEPKTPVVSSSEPSNSPKHFAPLKPKKPDSLHSEKIHVEAPTPEAPSTPKKEAPTPPAPRQQNMMDWQPLVPK